MTRSPLVFPESMFYDIIVRSAASSGFGRDQRGSGFHDGVHHGVRAARGLHFSRRSLVEAGRADAGLGKLRRPEVRILLRRDPAFQDQVCKFYWTLMLGI